MDTSKLSEINYHNPMLSAAGAVQAQDLVSRGRNIIDNSRIGRKESDSGYIPVGQVLDVTQDKIVGDDVKGRNVDVEC